MAALIRTEPQAGEGGRHGWRPPGPAPLLTQGHPQPAAQRCAGHLKDGDTTASPGNL